eukprot:1108965-Rhodomonas_salina.1
MAKSNANNQTCCTGCTREHTEAGKCIRSRSLTAANAASKLSEFCTQSVAFHELHVCIPRTELVRSSPN